MLAQGDAVTGGHAVELAAACTAVMAPSIWLAWSVYGRSALLRRIPRRKPDQPRPDYAKIAVLEAELLGIEPKPGTAAAFALGLVTFSQGVRRSEIDTWCAVYEHGAANTIAVPKPDGSVEILYQDPSGRHHPRN